MVQITWSYDPEAGTWDGNANNWHARVTAHPKDFVTYTAAVAPQDGSQPLELAPQSFEELEEAQAWCHREIYRLTHEVQ